MVWIVFVVSAALIVFAANKLAAYGDVIAERTRLGGMFVGVLLLAGAYSLWADWRQLSRADIFPYVIGLVVSYVVARLAIRFLMRLISRHTLAAFGWYRIALSLVLWVVVFRG